jgi:flagella basal body P-ring formation protein FlgA
MFLSFRLPMVILSMLAMAVSASAASYRPNATVDGNNVTLGDLFDGAGPSADDIVAAAPAPGQRMVFDAHALAALAQTHGLDWRPASPHDRAVVQRSAIIVGGDKIESLVEDWLAGHGLARPFAVVFDRQSIRLALPTNAGAVSVHDMSYDPQQKRFSGTLAASGPNGEIAVPVSGRVAAVVQVPVLSHALNQGEIVAAADIDLVRMQADRVARDAITDPEKIIGRTAARILTAEHPLRANDLVRDLVVKRGQTVTMVLDETSMDLTTQGRALTDGAKGDPVKVINISSSRVVEGVAAGPNLVAVSDGVPTISNEQGDAR